MNERMLIWIAVMVSMIMVSLLYWMLAEVRANRVKNKFMEKQLRLLARIAKKIGVDPDDVDNVVGGKKRRTHQEDIN